MVIGRRHPFPCAERYIVVLVPESPVEVLSGRKEEITDREFKCYLSGDRHERQMKGSRGPTVSAEETYGAEEYNRTTSKTTFNLPH